MTGLDDLLPAEEKVQEVLGDLPLDFRATAVVSNLPARDARTVAWSSCRTPDGLHTIEKLFPRFNAEEVSVTDHLRPDQQEALASMLRSMLRRVGTDAAG